MEPRTLTPEEQENVAKVKAGARKAGRPPKQFPSMLKAAVRALKETGLSNKDIAQQMGMTEENVQRMTFAGKSIKPEDMEIVKTEFASEFANLLGKLLNKAQTDEFLEKINGAQLITGMAILTDKILLLTGKPTAITETRSMAEEIQKQLSKLGDLEKALQGSIQVPPNPQVN